jgi:hypothetical protein
MKNISVLIKQKSFWNIVIFGGFFPIYLYGVQSSISIIGLWGILGIVLMIGYLWIIYQRNWRSYQIPIHFIFASILFMRVIAGNTIPVMAIVFILGGILFLIQEIISYREYTGSEVMRQIVLSGCVFLCFLTYTYIFGSVFIISISPFILSLITIASALNISSYLLWMYEVKTQLYYISYTIISLLTLQIFIGLRVLPFTHLTQGVLLTTFLIFSISLTKDVYKYELTFQKIALRLVFISILTLSLIFTSPV